MKGNACRRVGMGSLQVVLPQSTTTEQLLAEIDALNAHATVTICHSRTQGLEKQGRRADIVVGAVGKPELIRGSWIQDDAVVVDAGYHPAMSATSSSPPSSSAARFTRPCQTAWGR